MAAHDTAAHPAPDADGAYHRGAMDVHEQRSTYALFMGLTKWVGLGIAALVLFLVMLFAAGAGFIGAAIATVVLVAAGWFLLRTPGAKPAKSGADR